MPFKISPHVAGKLRWVTTSIARFDADAEWPPELNLQLKLNPAIRAFDGESLAGADASKAYYFDTPKLRMHSGMVRSPRALAITNGTWSATVQPLVPSSLEMPPDASVELRFGSDVQLEWLQSALQIRKRGDAKAPTAPTPVLAKGRDALTLAACRFPSRRCALATLNVALEVNTLYLLELPAQSKFHDAAGLTHSALTLTLSGLLPFAFPFNNSTLAVRFWNEIPKL